MREIEDLVKGLPYYEIDGPNGLYLTRYLLFGSFALPGDDEPQEPGNMSAFIHHFHTPDQDRTLHCHPWPWSYATVLRGGYTERRCFSPELGHHRIKEFTYKAGQSNSLVNGDYHAIDSLDGDTWTLFVCGHNTGKWGFWVEDHYVSWQEYLAK